MAGRNKKKTGIGIITFIVLCLCAIIFYRRIGLEKVKESREYVIKMKESELEEEQDRALDIKNLEAYVQTKKYIEEVAREKLGLVYEYEILFKCDEEAAD